LEKGVLRFGSVDNGNGSPADIKSKDFSQPFVHYPNQQGKGRFKDYHELMRLLLKGIAGNFL